MSSSTILMVSKSKLNREKERKSVCGMKGRKSYQSLFISLYILNEFFWKGPLKKKRYIILKKWSEIMKNREIFVRAFRKLSPLDEFLIEIVCHEIENKLWLSIKLWFECISSVLPLQVFVEPATDIPQWFWLKCEKEFFRGRRGRQW